MNTPKWYKKERKKDKRKELKTSIIIFSILTILVFSGLSYAYNNPFKVQKWLLSKQEYRVYTKSEEPTEFFIDKNVMDSLNIMFESYSNEFVVCLDGPYDNISMNITNMTSTVIYDSTERSVRHSGCYTPVTIHSHPNGVCKFSGADFFNYAFSVALETGLFGCVMCGTDQIACYNPSLEKSMVGRIE